MLIDQPSIAIVLNDCILSMDQGKHHSKLLPKEHSQPILLVNWSMSTDWSMQRHWFKGTWMCTWVGTPITMVNVTSRCAHPKYWGGRIQCQAAPIGWRPSIAPVWINRLPREIPCPPGDGFTLEAGNHRMGTRGASRQGSVSAQSVFLVQPERLPTDLVKHPRWTCSAGRPGPPMAESKKRHHKSNGAGSVAVFFDWCKRYCLIKYQLKSNI